jgi:hypothetical protein
MQRQLIYSVSAIITEVQSLSIFSSSGNCKYNYAYGMFHKIIKIQERDFYLENWEQMGYTT